MCKKTLLLTVVLSIVLACNSQGEVIHSTWVGGRWGLWEQASNWDPAAVPDNDDAMSFSVTVDANEDKCEIQMSEDHTVNRLDVKGRVRFTTPLVWPEPVLTLLDSNDGLSNHGFLALGPLVINLVGDVRNAPGAYLKGFLDTIEGNLLNEAAGRIDLYDHYLDVSDGNVYNHGILLCTPTGGVWAEHEFLNSGMIENYGGLCSSDGPFTNENTGVVRGQGMIHSDQHIINNGLIQSLGGDLTLHSRVDFEGPYYPNWGMVNIGTLVNSPGTTLTVMVWVPDVNNQGIIQVNADGSVVFDCNNLNNEPNGIIKLLGGTLAVTTITQKAGATLEGFGGIAGDITVEPNSPSEPNSIVRLTGPTNIVGDVSISEGATLEVSDGTTLITGHTTCNGTIHLKGGRIIPQGGLSGECNIIWEPGLYTNIADFNLDGKVALADFAYFADTWLWQTAWH